MFCLRRRRNLKSNPFGGSNQAEATCNTPPVLVPGQWIDKNDDRIALEISGCDVKGTWLTNDRVPFSGVSSGRDITMNFPDDSIVTGKVSDDGRRIDWDNETSWNYVSIANCPLVAGYIVLSDVDYGGNDIGNFGTDIDHLRAVCDQDPSCLGFNHNGWAKYAQPVLQDSPGNCYYVKDTWMPPPPATCNTPPDLMSGRWIDENDDKTLVNVSGCDVSGTWLTNDRVPFSGVSSGRDITMNFPDDSIVTGKVSDDGRRIDWDNGTFWSYG